MYEMNWYSWAEMFLELNFMFLLFYLIFIEPSTLKLPGGKCVIPQKVEWWFWQRVENFMGKDELDHLDFFLLMFSKAVLFYRYQMS